MPFDPTILICVNFLRKSAPGTTVECWKRHCAEENAQQTNRNPARHTTTGTLWRHRDVPAYHTGTCKQVLPLAWAIRFSNSRYVWWTWSTVGSSRHARGKLIYESVHTTKYKSTTICSHLRVVRIYYLFGRLLNKPVCVKHNKNRRLRFQWYKQFARVRIYDLSGRFLTCAPRRSIVLQFMLTPVPYHNFFSSLILLFIYV